MASKTVVLLEERMVVAGERCAAALERLATSHEAWVKACKIGAEAAAPFLEEGIVAIQAELQRKKKATKSPKPARKTVKTRR